MLAASRRGDGMPDFRSLTCHAERQVAERQVIEMSWERYST